MITSLDFKSITLAAGEVRPISVTGSVFSCLTSTSQFFVSFDGGPFVPFQGGLQLDNRPALFKQVIVQNRTATPLTLTFYSGTCMVTYSPVTVSVVASNAPTRISGGGILSLNGGASILSSGVNSGQIRKSIVLTNLDGVAMLHMCDPLGGVMLPVLAGESKMLETSGEVLITNPNGGAINYCVGETFYV